MTGMTIFTQRNARPVAAALAMPLAS